MTRRRLVAALAVPLLAGALPGCEADLKTAITAQSQATADVRASVEAVAETNAALVQRVEKLEAPQEASTGGWFSPVIQLGGIGGYGVAALGMGLAWLVYRALVRVMTEVEDAPECDECKAKETIKKRVKVKGGLVEKVLQRAAKRFPPKP